MLTGNSQQHTVAITTEPRPLPVLVNQSAAGIYCWRWTRLAAVARCRRISHCEHYRLSPLDVQP